MCLRKEGATGAVADKFRFHSPRTPAVHCAARKKITLGGGGAVTVAQARQVSQLLWSDGWVPPLLWLAFSGTIMRR